MDPLRPGLNLRRELLADGLTDAELRILRRHGVLNTIRPGAYVHSVGPVDAVPWHLLEAPAAAVERGAHRPRNGAARRVVAFADGGAESPGETRSRVALRRAGLPAPALQYPVGGTRCDFGWERFRTVAEFDGKVKYGRLRPGQDPGDAVFEEKVREDALRDRGLQVVRWIWAELDPFDAPPARLRRAFARG